MPTAKPKPLLPTDGLLKLKEFQDVLKVLATRLKADNQHTSSPNLMEQAMVIMQEALNMVKDSHDMKNEVNALKGRIAWRAMRIAAWKLELDRVMQALEKEKDPHRVRTALRSIKAQAMEWFEESEFSRVIEEEAVVKLSHRLKSWAEYGRMISESLRGTRPIEAIDLGQAARASIERWRPHAEKKGLRLSLAASLGLVVRGERELLGHVIENLIDNAIKATTTGKVEVFCRPEPTGVLLEVRDTGRGIPEERLAKLFEKPFYQGRGRKNMKRSTGVGLYLVAQYVRSLGGQVWAKSEVGKGSSFFVQLPKYNRERERSGAAA